MYGNTIHSFLSSEKRSPLSEHPVLLFYSLRYTLCIDASQRVKAVSKVNKPIACASFSFIAFSHSLPLQNILGYIFEEK